MRLLFFAIISIGLSSLQAKEPLKKAEWITEIDQRISILATAKNCFENAKSEKDYQFCLAEEKRKMAIIIKTGKTYHEIGIYMERLAKIKN